MNDVTFFFNLQEQNGCLGRIRDLATMAFLESEKPDYSLLSPVLADSASSSIASPEVASDTV